MTDVEVYDNQSYDGYDFLTLKMADGMSLKDRWFFKSPLKLTAGTYASWCGTPSSESPLTQGRKVAGSRGV